MEYNASNESNLSLRKKLPSLRSHYETQLLAVGYLRSNLANTTTDISPHDIASILVTYICNGLILQFHDKTLLQHSLKLFIFKYDYNSLHNNNRPKFSINFRLILDDCKRSAYQLRHTLSLGIIQVPKQLSKQFEMITNLNRFSTLHHSFTFDTIPFSYNKCTKYIEFLFMEYYRLHSYTFGKQKYDPKQKFSYGLSQKTQHFDIILQVYTKQIDNKKFAYFDFIKDNKSLINNVDFTDETVLAREENSDIEAEKLEQIANQLRLLDFKKYQYYFGVQTKNCCCKEHSGLKFEIVACSRT